MSSTQEDDERRKIGSNAATTISANKGGLSKRRCFDMRPSRLPPALSAPSDAYGPWNHDWVLQSRTASADVRYGDICPPFRVAAGAQAQRVVGSFDCAPSDSTDG
jgi:hypothetical protein